MKYFFTQKNRQTKKGFTLLEALVAISILMVAVAAPITIAQRGLSSAVYTKNQMIASYLAQDAIEYIKNRRDETALYNIANPTAPRNWLSDLENCLEANLCAVDTVASNGIGNILEGEGQSLKKDTDGFYRYDSGQDTGFIRTINIQELETDVKALLIVRISWPDSNEIVVKNLLFNY